MIAAKSKAGVLEGDTSRQIRQQLRERKLTPISVTEGGGRSSKSRASAATFRGSINTSELALITRQLATLSASGTPVEEALAAVSRHTEKQRIKTLLLSVRGKVLEGYSLAESLGGIPQGLPRNLPCYRRRW